MEKPSDQILTKIHAYVLRQLEMNREMTHKKLEKQVFERYGYSVSVAEILKEYTNQDGEFPFTNLN